MKASAPVDQDLADLDALAAGAQCVFHALPAANDGYPAQLLGEIHANILAPSRRDYRLFCERQVSEASFHNLDIVSRMLSAPATVIHAHS